MAKLVDTQQQQQQGRGVIPPTPNQGGAVADEVITRVAALETEQRFIRESINGIQNTLDKFINHFEQTKATEGFSRKDMIQVCFGAIALSGVFFTGAIYLIDSRVSPVNSAQISTALQINNRLDTFQDSIRGLREVQVGQQKDIGNVQVEISKMEDQVHASTRRWDSFDQDKLGEKVSTIKATQDANTYRIIGLEKRASDNEDRIIARGTRALDRAIGDTK